MPDDDDILIAQWPGPIGPGWYALRARAELPAGSPIDVRLHADMTDGDPPWPPAHGRLSAAHWERIVVLDRTVAGLRLTAEASTRTGVPAATATNNVEMQALSRVQAIAAMFRTPDLGVAVRWRMLRGLIGGMLGGRKDLAGAAMSSAYRSAWPPPATVTGRVSRSPLLPAWDHAYWFPAGDLDGGTGEQGWDARGNDPQLLLPGDQLGTPLRRGWYLLQARMRASEGVLSHPILYPDFGEGGSEADAIGLPDPDRNGWISHVVMFRCEVNSLRFDPSIRAVRFTLGGLTLRRLSRMEAAWRMLRALMPGKVPRSLLPVLKREGISAAANELHARYRDLLAPETTDYPTWIRAYDSLRATDQPLLQRRALAVADGPLISVLVPVYETPERWLRRCLDSVLAQAYSNWELCIADDASPSPHVQAVLQEYAQRDPRVRIERRERNGHISAASNTALAMARGEYIALLDHDDELRPHALLEMAEAIVADPARQLLYSDEDKIDERGRRFQPNFKPDWNPDLLRSQNYVCHLSVIHTALAREAGGFREGFEGSQDHDLILRCSERLQTEQIHHVPRVLYHWRAIEGSTARERGAKDYAAEAGLRAVQSHLDRIAQGARAEHLAHGHYRVRWPIAQPAPRVSLVIPTRDRLELLRVCVDSILQRSSYPDIELLIVDNQSSEPETLAWFAQVVSDPRVRVLKYDAPFNYSAINNMAVAQSSGGIVGLVNNDIEVRQPDWIEELAGHALREDVGAVGPMLYYPDDTIQHAGVILGIGGVANHPYTGRPHGYPGHGARALVTQNLSAVTGACLFVRKAVYDEVGGLDERLQVAFNDIDFCLRLMQRGYRNVWTPMAALTHHESASRGADDTPEKSARFEREVETMRERWEWLLGADPAYNPNLTLSGLDSELGFPPRHGLRGESSSQRTRKPEVPPVQ